MTTYYSAKFSGKLHENEKSCAERGRAKFYLVDPPLVRYKDK